MKRVIIAITVEDDVVPADLAQLLAVQVEIDRLLPDPDATAWEWEAFGQDHTEGTVSPVVDLTSRLTYPTAAIRDREQGGKT